MPSEIAQQLAALLAGDQQAAAWLYDSFAPRLYRRLRQRYAYPGGPDADDLLQEAYLFYFQHDGRVLRRYLERTPEERCTAASLEAYLWDLACGLASNHRRKLAVRKKVVPLPEAWEIPADPAAETGAVSRDLLERLEACLKEGRERVFLYFSLRYQDGLSPRQIAEACGWSRKAAYKLKQALDEAVTECARQLGLLPS